MSDARDDFSKETARTLGERVGLFCSRSGCRAPTKAAHTDDAKALSVGVAAHILGASPLGPRYDPSQLPEERSAITNGIWLCASCATLVDKDPARYPAELLRAWKVQAEHEATERLEKRGATEGPSVVDRLRAIPSGAIARLWYLLQNRETHHDVDVTIEGVDDSANVFRFRMTMGLSQNAPFGVPLRDVQDTWCLEGKHHVRVSGYMDHRILEPYRYVSRETSATQTPSRGAGLAEAKRFEAVTMLWVASIELLSVLLSIDPKVDLEARLKARHVWQRAQLSVAILLAPEVKTALQRFDSLVFEADLILTERLMGMPLDPTAFGEAELKLHKAHGELKGAFERELPAT